MWFLSKQKRQGKESVRFLRKGLPEQQRKHRIVEKKEGRRIGVGTLFLWVLFFGTLFYTAFFSTFFLTGEPSIIGMSEVSEEKLRGFVDDQLSGKYLWIFSRHNFFWVHPRELETKLRLEYPLLASASVTRVFPDRIVIAVTERKRILLWESGEQSYLLDEDGVAHESAQALLPENAPYVLTIGDMSNKGVAFGERVIDAKYELFVLQMDELFPEQLGLVLEPRYTTVSHFADELRVKTDEGWEAYFSTDIPIESSLNVLRLLFEKELPKAERAKLAYIDLRAENRAYYAYREGEDVGNPVAASVPVPQPTKNTDASKKK